MKIIWIDKSRTPRKKYIITIKRKCVILNLSLENISSKVHISRYYLCHTFKKQIGMSVFEYVLSRRLSKAKHYLAHTDIPISHITDKTVFRDLHISAKFSEKMKKITPSQFRLKNKQT